LNNAKYYIGTAGWNYDDWIGTFYSAKQSVRYNWLSYYSKFFNFVEVNSSFYTFLTPKIIIEWLNILIDNYEFKFSIKLHQSFTHQKSFSKEDVKKVYSILKLLTEENRIFGILLQFPYSFNFNTQNFDYLCFACELFLDYNIFVEFRHNSWINEKILNYFNDNKINLAAIDMPLIGDSLPLMLNKNQEIQYIRLHGRNRIGWIKSIKRQLKEENISYDRNEKYNYLYSIEELKDLANVILNANLKSKIYYIVFNNHPQGKAIANALQMKGIVNPYKFEFIEKAEQIIRLIQNKSK